MSTVTDLGILRACLTGAVPLSIEQLRRMSPYKRASMREAWARDAVDPLASEGDGILRKTPELPDEPGTAKTFNHLVRSIAALAFAEGGIHMFGLIWCAEHSPSGAVPDSTAPDGATTDTVPCGQCASREDS